MATYQTAKDEFVTVDGVRFAFRRLGLPSGTPLVLLMHFRSVHPRSFMVFDDYLGRQTKH